jgi:hypothetical protein
MIQFAISEVLNVRSTTFPRRDTHKGTWCSADSRTVNRTDQVSISNIFRSAITHIITLRGLDTVSDLNLLKINFKEKLRVKTGNKYN